MTRFIWGLVLAAALGGHAAQADSGRVPLTRVSLGEIGGWIALAVEADGAADRWYLDTGASRNLVSPDFAQRHGLKPRSSVVADTALGQLQGGEVALPVLRVGTLARADQTALAVDLRKLLGDAAEGIAGVLGVPFLDGLQVELDLREWAAEFREGAASDCPGGTSAQALRRHRKLPVISVGVGADTEEYVLDTGNPAGLVRVEAEPPTAATPGLALTSDQRLTLLRQATIGTQRRSDVPVVRLTAATLKRSFGTGLRGLAGVAFIDGARWRLDLTRGQLCVEDGAFATPGGFGLTLQRRDGVLRVAAVLPGGPAELAGLREGEPVAQWPGGATTRPLAELWSAVHEHEEIELAIGEPARTVTLRRALFAPAAPR